MVTTKKHIEDVRVGDCILCADNYFRTVCYKDIFEDRFMGKSIFGDTHKSGHELVTVFVRRSSYGEEI